MPVRELEFSNQCSPLQLECKLGKDVLLVRSLEGSERLSGMSEYRAEFVSTRDNITPKDVLGTQATITVAPRGVTPRVFTAFFATFERCPRDDSPFELSRYRATLVPWLWMARLKTDCRIFQFKDTVTIIKEALHDVTPSGTIKDVRSAKSKWPTREYCVQYQESTCNFVHRLLEDEGTFYYFEQHPGRHELVLGDSVALFPKAKLREKSTLHYRRSFAPGPTHEIIWDWRVRSEVRTNALDTTDYNYLRPTAMMQASRESPAAVKHWKSEQFCYPGNYAEQGIGEGCVATTRLGEIQSEYERYSGVTNSPGLVPGVLFDLADNPLAGSGGTYAVVETNFHATNSDLLAAMEGMRDDSHQFESRVACIPAAAEFRPIRSATRPRMQGPQTAVITGKKGDEICTDEHGRVKVQFFWDRYGKHDDKSSCWMRVSQPWAGKGWGGVQIPRVGQEVIVDFLEGDPDRPVITGRVYNAGSMPPVSASGRDPAKGEANPKSMVEAAMQMTMRSNSLGGSGGFNEITMHDAGGAEKLFIRAQKDEVHLVQNDRKDTVGHDELRDVANDRTRSVGKNEKVTVGKNRTKDVGSSETISIGKNKTETISIANTQTVGAANTITVGGANTHTVGAAYTLTVGGMSTTTVGLLANEFVGLNKTITVGETFEIVCGESKITMKKDGTIEIVGKTIKIAGADYVDVDSTLIDLN
jgi:type VI secretion system secreted protein VgrG